MVQTQSHLQRFSCHSCPLIQCWNPTSSKPHILRPITPHPYNYEKGTKHNHSSYATLTRHQQVISPYKGKNAKVQQGATFQSPMPSKENNGLPSGFREWISHRAIHQGNPSPPPDTSSSSSSSSLSSSHSNDEDNSSTTTGSTSSDSYHNQNKCHKSSKYRSHRSKGRHNHRSRDRRDQTHEMNIAKQMRKIMALFNKLCKSAKNHNLKDLSIDGEPGQRRYEFIRWIEALKDILQTHHKTLTVLSNYPMVPTKIDSITNEALGLFLCAHVSASIKGVLVGTDPKSGLAILVRLQRMYASATMEDRVNALFYLIALQMHPKDTMNNFIMKFRRAIKAVVDVSQESHPPPTDFYLINLFL